MGLRLEAWFDIPYPKIPKSYPSYTAKQLSLLKRALSTIVLPEKLELWIQELRTGHDDLVISLLLVLLPNMTSLVLQNPDDFSFRSIHLKEVVKRIKSDCIAGLQTLGRLQQIDLSFDTLEDWHKVDLLALLATIPSLKSLYSQYLITFGNAYDFSCLLPGPSNITDLGFKRCRFSLGELGGLLQGMKALKKFRYIHEDTEPVSWPPVPTTAVTDLAEMRKLLLKYAWQSLERLDLRVKDEPVGPIGSLQDFEALQELTLSFSLFQLGNGHRPQTLMSWLPKRLRKLSLHDFENKDAALLGNMEDTVSEAVRFKSDYLPRLEQICFAIPGDMSAHVEALEELHRLCEGAGFELCVLKERRGSEEGDEGGE